MDASTPSASSEVRLNLDPALSGKGMLDGGWWPHSTDPLVELPVLIAALNSHVGTVFRITLNQATWLSNPKRITVAGHTVRLGWHGPHDIHELSVSGAGRDRLDLLVVPPDTAPDAARTAMETAAAGGNHAHGTAILEAQSAPDANAGALL
jgi:hypothetical protein